MKSNRADDAVDPIGDVGVAQGLHSPVEDQWIRGAHGLDHGRLHRRRLAPAHGTPASSDAADGADQRENRHGLVSHSSDRPAGAAEGAPEARKLLVAHRRGGGLPVGMAVNAAGWPQTQAAAMACACWPGSASARW